MVEAPPVEDCLESPATPLSLRDRRPRTQCLRRGAGAAYVAARHQQAGPAARGRARRAGLRAPGQAARVAHARRRRHRRVGTPHAEGDRQPETRRRGIPQRGRRHARDRDDAHAGALRAAAGAARFRGPISEGEARAAPGQPGAGRRAYGQGRRRRRHRDRGARRLPRARHAALLSMEPLRADAARPSRSARSGRSRSRRSPGIRSSPTTSRSPGDRRSTPRSRPRASRRTSC